MNKKRESEDLEKLQNPYDMEMKNVLQLGKMSYEMEEHREQSLISQSNSMLTAFSLYSAALLMALPILISYSGVPVSWLLSASILVITPVFSSLILTILAQWRFGYQTMYNGEAFMNAIESDFDSYKSQGDYDYQMMLQLTRVQSSKQKNNDKRLNFIKAAMILFLISCGMLLLSGIVFFILCV